LFAYGLSQSSTSLVASANLIKKIYFPRLVIPIASVLSALVDFGIALAVVLGMMVWYGIAPTVHVLWLPGLVLLALVTALGWSQTADTLADAQAVGGATDEPHIVQAQRGQQALRFGVQRGPTL
jgi:ABC-type polysaccharide/polyol phosphate export permease